MRFVADQCVAGPIIDRLRADGLDVLAVRDVAPGIQDPNVLAMAHHADAVLLTEDKDFGELVFREGSPHRGIVLIRVDSLRRDERAEVVSAAVRAHHADLPGAFVVVTPTGVRVRKTTLPTGGDSSV